MRKGYNRSKGANYYKKGSYNVICDLSGIKCKAEDTKMTWDGLRVKTDWWEARHPQDFTTTLRDKQSVPNPRPEQANEFVTDALDPAKVRVTESLDVRVTEDGEIRVTE